MTKLDINIDLTPISDACMFGLGIFMTVKPAAVSDTTVFWIGVLFVISYGIKTAKYIMERAGNER
jgi:arginine exporter protein ArgO